MKIMKKILMIVIIFAVLFGYSDLQAKSNKLDAKDTIFVELVSIIPDVVTDVRYATENNFTKKVLYPSDRVFLRKIVADSLRSAQEKFKKLGYYIVVFDGYRPLSVQHKMWEILPDANYVADPKIGSKHNRGAAVDLTLMDTSGNIVDMGTEFDDFTEKASPNYSKLPEQILKNREILSSVMKECGFLPIDTEWWHYDFYLWKEFSISNFEIE